MATISTRKKKTSTTVIPVGASSAAPAHPDIAAEASRLSQKKAGGISSLLVDGHRYILTAAPGAAHLVGGEEWRLAAAAAVKALRAADVTAATVAIDGDEGVLQAFVEGLLLADYVFSECSTAKPRPELTLHITGANAAVTGRDRRGDWPEPGADLS